MNLDSPERIDAIRARIREKPALKLLYLETYEKYRACLDRCPKDGIAIELGSGGSFLKDVLPTVLTTDLLPYAGVDQVVDACNLPFPDQSLRAIFLANVFHHIADVEKFFSEAARCLKPGGRIFILDPYCGWFGALVYRYLHHEPYHPDVKEWKFESSGALSDSNIALAGMVFERDLEKFKILYPELSLVSYTPHTPLRYWLSGGLKFWTLLPRRLFPLASLLDQWLTRLSRGFACFVDVEIVKK